MKKDIAKRLNSIADDLPLIFEWENGSYEITGYELNLTPYGVVAVKEYASRVMSNYRNEQVNL